MFKETLCRKLKTIKKGVGKYVWLQFWDFYFFKENQICLQQLSFNWWWKCLWLEMLHGMNFKDTHMDTQTCTHKCCLTKFMNLTLKVLTSTFYFIFDN